MGKQGTQPRASEKSGQTNPSFGRLGLLRTSGTAPCRLAPSESGRPVQGFGGRSEIPPRIHVHVVVVVGTVVVVVAVVVVTGMVVVVLGTVVVVVVRGTVVVVAGAVVLVVVVGGADVVVGRVVVVVVAGGRVVVVVLRIVASGGGALDGDVATGGLLSVARSALLGNDGIRVRDDALRPNGGWVVVIVATTFAVVVVLLVTVVGTILVTFARWTESVGGTVSDAAKAHTSTPVTASAATTSTTRGCQTPSR